MPKITETTIKKTPPAWLQQEEDRHVLLMGGGHLERTEFTLPNSDSNNVVYSGTLVGRTYADRESGIGYGPADLATDDDGQIFLLLHDVNFDDDFLGVDGQCSLCRHGSQVAESSIPGWATMDAATQAKIRQLYQTI